MRHGDAVFLLDLKAVLAPEFILLYNDFHFCRPSIIKRQIPISLENFRKG